MMGVCDIIPEPKMNFFQEYAKPHIKTIESLLENHLRAWKKDVDKKLPKISPMADLFVKANAGGGRLRGVLIILGYETALRLRSGQAGGKMVKEAVKAAVALELFQTSILAHDDVVDKSELRRGIPTLYRAIAAWHKKNRMLGDPGHFGASQAVNLGSTGFFLASEILAQTKFPPENKLKAISAFNNLIVYTALGQILDITIPAEKGLKKEEDVLAVERYKTAQYTAVGPLCMGACLAGASEILIKNLTLFGENLGIAFQIQDDIKGVFGKSEETGKSAKEDIAEGKITLLFIKAGQKVKGKGQNGILKKFYGKAELTEEEAEKVRQVFRETGALRYAIKRSKEYADAARAQIPKITRDKKYRGLYSSLADFVLKAR